MDNFVSFLRVLAELLVACSSVLAAWQSFKAVTTAKSVEKKLDSNPEESANKVVQKLVTSVTKDDLYRSLDYKEWQANRPDLDKP